MRPGKSHNFVGYQYSIYHFPSIAQIALNDLNWMVDQRGTSDFVRKFETGDADVVHCFRMKPSSSDVDREKVAEGHL